MSEHKITNYFKWIFIFSAITLGINFIFMLMPSEASGIGSSLLWAIASITSPITNVMSFLLSLMTFTLFINLLIIKKNSTLWIYFWISSILILVRGGNMTAAIVSLIVRENEEINFEKLWIIAIILETIFSILTVSVALIGSEIARQYGVDENYSKYASKINKATKSKEISNDEFIEKNKDYKELIVKIDTLLKDGKITKEQYKEIKEKFEVQLIRERNKKYEEKNEK